MGKPVKQMGVASLSNTTLKASSAAFSDALAITPDFIQPKLKNEDQKVRGAHAEIRGQIIRNSGTDKPLRPGDCCPLGNYNHARGSTGTSIRTL